MIRKELEPVSGRYGAPMGRRGEHGEPEPGARFYLRRVYLSQGYDSRGAYWGMGAPLYYFESSCGEVSGHLRARDRRDAKQKVESDHPGARFYV